MKNSRLSLDAFGKQSVKNAMLDKISGGRVAVVQEYCHPGDAKNAVKEATDVKGG